jgi:hypothetical protein
LASPEIVEMKVNSSVKRELRKINESCFYNVEVVQCRIVSMITDLEPIRFGKKEKRCIELFQIDVIVIGIQSQSLKSSGSKIREDYRL